MYSIKLMTMNYELKSLIEKSGAQHFIGLEFLNCFLRIDMLDLNEKVFKASKEPQF